MYGYHTRLPAQSRNDWKTIRSLLPYLWEYKGRVGVALAALVCAKLANVGVPLILKDVVDQLTTEPNKILVLPVALLVGYGALRVATAAFNELRDSVFARVRYGAMRKLSIRVMKHLHQLSLRYHLERKTGAITRDLERGTRSVASLLNYLLFSILPTLVEVTLIAGILLANYNPWFAVITFSAVLIYITFTVLITNWRMKYRVTMNQADSKANSHAIDSLLNYETVKYFGNEHYESQRYDASLSHWEDAAVKSQTSLSALNVGQGFIIGIAVTAIMLLASKGVVNGELTIGDLVLINAFLLQLFIPLNFLGIVYSQLKHALTDMEQLFALMEQVPEVQDRADAHALQVGDGAIRFDCVDFHYQDNRPILQQVSFTVPAGKKVAIVGSSGAGKSTIARLLFRFYDVTDGQILINEQDIRSVAQDSLRRVIGIVPQDTVLFNDTIFYNIAYADPNASQAAITAAAKVAHIHDFIVSLPDGYDTVVGERGLKLSGGEKQRVAIARAVLKQPKILIFDEATSSLDSKSEQAILQALKEVAQNHTTLVIAHRLSTIIDADQILVLDQGSIVERGNHDQLLENNSLYANMWELQKQVQPDLANLSAEP